MSELETIFRSLPWESKHERKPYCENVTVFRPGQEAEALAFFDENDQEAYISRRSVFLYRDEKGLALAIAEELKNYDEHTDEAARNRKEKPVIL